MILDCVLGQVIYFVYINSPEGTYSQNKTSAKPVTQGTSGPYVRFDLRKIPANT